MSSRYLAESWRGEVRRHQTCEASASCVRSVLLIYKHQDQLGTPRFRQRNCEGRHREVAVYATSASSKARYSAATW